MKTVLLLGFEENEVVSGDLVMLHAKFGKGEDLTLKPIYPKSQAEHTALCQNSGRDVVAVLLLEHRFFVIPDATARQLVPHIMFSSRSGERMGYQALGIDVRLSPAMMRPQQTS